MKTKLFIKKLYYESRGLRMLRNLQGGSQNQYPKESPRMGIEKTVIHWILKKLRDLCF